MAKLTESELSQFHSTENYYLHWAKRIKYTDGVQFLAEKGEAYWLIDAIASYQHPRGQGSVPFQVWTLKLNKEDAGAVLTMIEDTGQPERVRQEIPFTDFPLAEIKLWLIGGVLILPSEY